MGYASAEWARKHVMSNKQRLKLYLILIGILILPMKSMAADYYVATDGDNNNDCLSVSSPCLTINAAFSKVAVSGDTIFIAAGTYSENLEINKDLTFTGEGAANTILQAPTDMRVMSNISEMTISMMTLQDGAPTSGYGGCISNSGVLTLNNAEVKNCQVMGGNGGGIANTGTLTANDSIINGNSAGSGAGIWNSGTLTLNQTNILNNQTTSQGGALFNHSSGTMNVYDATLSGNTSGGNGIGLFNDGGTVTIARSTFSGNSGSGGNKALVQTQIGGIVELTNVTISGNTAVEQILQSSPASPLTVLNSTITNNDGYIRVYDDIAMLFKNTIVSGNNGSGDNCIGFFAHYTTSLGNNIEDGDSCNFSDVSDQIGTDPLLQPLGAYGGPTQTHALQDTSPAVDTANDSGCPATDQRGVIRPIDGDFDTTPTCDIGAFEFDSVPLTGVSLSGSITGLTNSLYTFEATAAPANVSLPVTYLWEADGQSDVLHKGGGNSDTVSFTWFSDGVYTVTVTADNGFTQQVETHDITISRGQQEMTSVIISGPDTGSTGQQYSFSASVLPLDSTIPITYTWQTDGQADIVHATSALTDEVTLSWNDDGPHTVTVTAVNNANQITSSHVLTTSSWFVDQTTGDDNNDCLSAASPCLTIQEAVSKSSSGHTIKIAAGIYGETVYIDKDLTLIGAGTGQTRIDGENSRRGINIASAATVTVRNMTVQNGNADDGAGVANYGNLTLENVVVENCSASISGGGIYNHSTGVLAILSSTVQGNSSEAGAAINNHGQVTLEKSTLTGNDGVCSGGCDIVRNMGVMDMTNVTVSNNLNGIVLASNTLSSTVSIVNSTIAENSHSIANSGIITLKNVILANNGSGGNCMSPLTSQGYNLDSGDSCGFNQAGDVVNSDPLLLPLADNGGSTLTHAVRGNSPAVDTGDNTICPSTDQRNVLRPVDGNRDTVAVCDIGAYELSEEEISSPWTLFLPCIISTTRK